MKKESGKVIREILWTTDTLTYEWFEKQSKSKYVRKCIDNRTVGSNKCVGYCNFEEHRGFLTRKLRKKHNCIKKKCHYYIQKNKSTNTGLKV